MHTHTHCSSGIIKLAVPIALYVRIRWMSTNYAKLEWFVFIRGITIISNVKMGTNGPRSAHIAQAAVSNGRSGELVPSISFSHTEKWRVSLFCMEKLLRSGLLSRITWAARGKKSPFKKVENDDWVSEEVSAINHVQTRSPNDVERCKSGVLKLIFKVMMNCIYWLEAMSRHGPFFKVTLEMESKPCWDGLQGLRQLPKPRHVPTRMS